MESAYVFETECGLSERGFVTVAAEGPLRPTVDVPFTFQHFFFNFKTLLCAYTSQRVMFW